MMEQNKKELLMEQVDKKMRLFQPSRKTLCRKILQMKSTFCQ